VKSHLSKEIIAKLEKVTVSRTSLADGKRIFVNKIKFYEEIDAKKDLSDD